MDTQEKNNFEEVNIISSSDNIVSETSQTEERITLEEIYKLARKIYESS